jgi:hypothetical protein
MSLHQGRGEAVEVQGAEARILEDANPSPITGCIKVSLQKELPRPFVLGLLSEERT